MTRNLLRVFLFFAITLLTLLLWNKLFLNEGSFPEKKVLSITNTSSSFFSNIDSKRVWIKDTLKAVSGIHPDLTDSVFTPEILKAYNDMLIVADFTDMRIKMFSPQGKLIYTYGKIGRGPGEFNIFNDFTVHEDLLYVINHGTMSIHIFSLKTNQYLRSILPKSRTSRITFVSGELVTLSELDEFMFDVFDHNDSLIASFGEILENQNSNPLSLSGYIDTLPDDKHFVYIPNFASYLFFYSPDGNSVKTIQTIDGISFSENPRSTNQDGNLFISRPKPDVVVLDYAIDDKYIYLLNNKQTKELDLPTTFLDIYDLYTGEYQNSYEFKRTTEYITILNDRLYLKDYLSVKIEAYELPDL